MSDAEPGSRNAKAQSGCLPGLIDVLTSLVAQMVRHLPAMPETWVRFLGQEDPLEKEMAFHSRTLAWKIPRSDTTEQLHFHFLSLLHLYSYSLFIAQSFFSTIILYFKK